MKGFQDGRHMVPTSALLKSPEDVGRSQEAADELQVAAPAAQVIGNWKHVVENNDPQPADHNLDCSSQGRPAIALGVKVWGPLVDQHSYHESIAACWGTHQLHNNIPQEQYRSILKMSQRL